MAHDPDWDDEAVPPSLNELYREQDSRLVYVTERNRQVYLAPLNEFCLSMMQSPSVTTLIFRDFLLDRTINRIKMIILDCAEELIDTVIFDILAGVIDETILYTLAAACLSIAIKIFGAYDWINENNVVPVIFQKSNKMITDPEKKVSKRKVILIESDILRRTDWKGCASNSDIRRVYEEIEDNEPEVVYQPSAENMVQKRLDEIRGYRIGGGFDPDVDMYKFTLAHYKGDWIFIHHNTNKGYTASMLQKYFGIDTAIVDISYKFVRDLMNAHRTTKEKILHMIVNRILRKGFHLRHGELRLIDNRSDHERSLAEDDRDLQDHVVVF